MEITVLSAEGLKSTSSRPFSHRLRPFVTLTTYQPVPCNTTDKNCQVFTTRIDDQGGANPTWGDKFHVPMDAATLFANRYSCIYVELYTKRLLKGKVLLGWCQIPVTDIGFPPDSSVRHLSYRIRDRDGTRGQGIINLAIKLTDFEQGSSQRLSDNINSSDHQKASDGYQTVIGIPVTVFPHMNFCE
ncbi:BON1-associated protein 2 [Ricinus communis]|uniref:BON1-associated protein 2 n=1 Tax=Ricinus communis TaxID=3988 RepID=UPI000772BE57|nr:BON1-associated protein 2 [Ricinus communis]|eukprot:XP_015584545.1 BON1-associated protein 2 [Ricinus communis]